MPVTELPNHEAAILRRVIRPEEPPLSAAAARGLLALGFSQADKDRMHEVAAKARAGTLTAEEQAEVEAYSLVSSLIGILHSKARRALKSRRGTNGKPKTH
jgi:hypothetical protein